MTITVVDVDNNPVEGATVNVVKAGTVTVTTIDKQGNPLEYSTVLICTSETPSLETVLGVGQTDENGTTLIYEFDEEGRPTSVVARIPYGTYYLMGINEPLGYQSNDFVVDGNENVTITLTEPTHNFTVQVQDQDTDVVANATVQIGDVGGFDTPLSTGTTDGNGEANFTMPYGEYYVRVIATGYTQDGDYYWVFDDTISYETVTVTRDGD